MNTAPLRRRLEAVEAKITSHGKGCVVEFRPRGMDDAAYAAWHEAMSQANAGRNVIVVEFVAANGKVT